jgi:hypothetical protein
LGPHEKNNIEEEKKTMSELNQLDEKVARLTLKQYLKSDTLNVRIYKLFDEICIHNEEKLRTLLENLGIDEKMEHDQVHPGVIKLKTDSLLKLYIAPLYNSL